MKQSSLFVFAVVSWAVFALLGVFFLFAVAAGMGHGGGNADPIYFFLVAILVSAVVSAFPAVIGWSLFRAGLEISGGRPTEQTAATRAFVYSLATSVLTYATAIYFPGSALFWAFGASVVAFSFLASFTIRNRVSVRPAQAPLHARREHEG